MARIYTMIPSRSLTVVILLALRVGVALSFSTRLRRSSSPRLAVGSVGSSRSGGGTASSRSTSSSKQRGPGTLLPLSSFSSSSSSSSSSSALDDDGSASSATGRDARLSKRRAFLANFAATSLPTIVASLVADPSSASARGYPIDESGPLVYGADDIMSPKEHGTSSAPVQETLRYGVSRSLADKICSFNRVFAEMGGYFEGSTSFERDVRSIVAGTGGPVTFYDSVTGKPLFRVRVPPASSMCCCLSYSCHLHLVAFSTK